jgi:hypothetical protein
MNTKSMTTELPPCGDEFEAVRRALDNLWSALHARELWPEAAVVGEMLFELDRMRPLDAISATN